MTRYSPVDASKVVIVIPAYLDTFQQQVTFRGWHILCSQCLSQVPTGQLPLGSLWELMLVNQKRSRWQL
jgi:hypothetical protein